MTWILLAAWLLSALCIAACNDIAAALFFTALTIVLFVSFLAVIYG